MIIPEASRTPNEHLRCSRQGEPYLKDDTTFRNVSGSKFYSLK